MTLSVQDANDVRYAHINLYGHRSQCSVENQRLALGPGLIESLRAQMPALDFPPDTLSADSSGPRAVSASNAPQFARRLDEKRRQLDRINASGPCGSSG